MGININRYIGSVIWLLIGIFIAVRSYLLGLGRLQQPGPGFIIFLFALLLIILSLIDLAWSFFSTPAPEEDTQPMWGSVRWQKVLLVLVALFVYAYFLKITGFLLTTYCLMLFLFKIIEFTRWWIAVISSLITIVVSYTLFKWLLDIQFPTGILGY